jgi:hypothetical protein
LCYDGGRGLSRALRRGGACGCCCRGRRRPSCRGRRRSCRRDGGAVPRHGVGMTSVARRLRDEVVSTLALGSLVVVTIRTRSERLGVIDETIVAPGRGLMAAFAVIGRFGMGKNGCGAGRRHAIVAAKAGPRCGLETRVDMARRTRNRAMCPGKRKSSHIVIEF